MESHEVNKKSSSSPARPLSVKGIFGFVLRGGGGSNSKRRSKEIKSQDSTITTNSTDLNNEQQKDLFIDQQINNGNLDVVVKEERVTDIVVDDNQSVNNSISLERKDETVSTSTSVSLEQDSSLPSVVVTSSEDQQLIGERKASSSSSVPKGEETNSLPKTYSFIEEQTTSIKLKTSGKLPWQKPEATTGTNALPPFLSSLATAAAAGGNNNNNTNRWSTQKPIRTTTTPVNSGSNQENKGTAGDGLRSAAILKTSMKLDGLKTRRQTQLLKENLTNDLSLNERAFLPGGLVRSLISWDNKLLPAPTVLTTKGVVLFVDVSGFTQLAELLNKNNVPVKANEKLASMITRVLEVLVMVCITFCGEVEKFAGDALLCVWEMEDLNKAELLAKHCAIRMLLEMEHLNKIERTELQLHGGIAKGELIHFHIGGQANTTDELRWYLISGQAVSDATQLVNQAPAGQFAFSSSAITDILLLSSGTELPPKPSTELEESNRQKCSLTPLSRNYESYIPKQLQQDQQLDWRSKRRGEMRRRISIVFVGLSSIDEKNIPEVNRAFLTMTSIVHEFEGETRDMLFDDKGCVYIAVFGAHCQEEREDVAWNVLATKAAMAISKMIPNSRIGVSMGTCFVGMCGVLEKRTDLLVIGHEVNMASRYMQNCSSGQVLVSSSIYSSTKNSIQYSNEISITVGKGEFAKQKTVYSPLVSLS